MRRFFLPLVGSVLALALISSTPGSAQPGAAPTGKLRVLAVARKPFASENSPGGGLIVDLLAAALRQSGASDIARMDLDVKWTKEWPTLPFQSAPGAASIDIILPVEEPGCDRPKNLTPSLAELCDQVVFSEPMLQVVVGLFALDEGGIALDSDEKIFGKTICVAQDHDISTLNADGRDWVS